MQEQFKSVDHKCNANFSKRWHNFWHSTNDSSNLEINSTGMTYISSMIISRISTCLMDLILLHGPLRFVYFPLNDAHHANATFIPSHYNFSYKGNREKRVKINWISSQNAVRTNVASTGHFFSLQIPRYQNVK